MNDRRGRKTNLFNVICTWKNPETVTLLVFQPNTICSNGAVWQEIILKNELVKYTKTDTLLISIQNMKPAKKF